MSGFSIIYGEIIVSKQRVQFKIDPSIQNNEINPNIIKAFLKEVELDEQYYDKASILFQAGEQYFKAIGKKQIYDLENAQKWINSNELIDMTYALKWIYEFASKEEKAMLNYNFNVNQEIWKKIIILNIALEQQIQIPISSLINLLDENCEIIYCISQYIQSTIQIQQFEELQPLLHAIINFINGEIYNNLTILQLMESVHSQFSEQKNIPKLNLKQFKIQNWENRTIFATLEKELPLLILRRSREVYNFTQSQYESYRKDFFTKWYFMDMVLEDEFEDNPISVLKSSDRKKSRLRTSAPVVLTTKQKNQTQGKQNGAPKPPPAPLSNSTNNTNSLGNPYIQYNKLPILQQNLNETIWSIQLTQNPQINQDNLKYFLKKQVIKKQLSEQKETIVYSEAILKESGIKLELLQNKISKFNLIKTMEQINQLEFLEINQNNEMRSILDSLQKVVELIPEDFENKYEIKIKEVMLNNQQNQNKNSINRNDQFLKQIYDLNLKKGIQIEFFHKEHIENQDLIENQVLQFTQIFEEIKKDQELILYFHYIKEYGKIFNNIKLPSYGYKFENLIEFSYKTSQLESKQEELIKFIVEDMMNQDIKFQGFDDPYYQQLEILSKESNSLSEIKKTIQLYQKQNLWLENHIKTFENNQTEINFFNKANKYCKLYKDFIFNMEMIFNESIKNYELIRRFFCDFRTEVETPQFFGDILKIKKNLREQYVSILFQRKKQQQKLLQKPKKR